MDTPITDRYRLRLLHKWVQELSEKKTYRWIAAHTWRGKESHGFWERVAKGVHLEKKPRVRAREQDWHDIHILHRTFKEYDSDHEALFDKTLVVISRRAELDAAIADLLVSVRRVMGKGS